MWKQQGGEPNADDVGVVPRLIIYFSNSSIYSFSNKFYAMNS